MPTAIGMVEIEVLRYRDRSREPMIAPKRTHGWAASMAHPNEVYGAKSAEDTISRITEKFTFRPSDPICPVTFVDAIVVKIPDGQILGVDLHPSKEVMSANRCLRRPEGMPENPHRFQLLR